MSEELTEKKVREWVEAVSADSERGVRAHFSLLDLAESWLRLKAREDVVVERPRKLDHPHVAWEAGYSTGYVESAPCDRVNPYPKPDASPPKALTQDAVVEAALGTVRAAWHAPVSRIGNFREWLLSDAAPVAVAAALAKLEVE